MLAPGRGSQAGNILCSFLGPFKLLRSPLPLETIGVVLAVWTGVESQQHAAGPAQRAGHRRKELLSVVGFTQPHHSYQVWDTSSFDDKVLLGANHFLWSCFYCSLSSPLAGWLQWLVA